MIVRISTAKLDRMPTSIDDIPPKGASYTVVDATSFLEAETHEDAENLMASYSSPYAPLFGIIEEADDDDFPFGLPETGDTPASFGNLSELMRTFVKLLDLQKSLFPHRGEQYEYAYVSEIEALGIEVSGLEHTSSIGYTLSMRLALDVDESTLLFLQKGVAELGGNSYGCRADNLNDLEGKPYALLLTITTRYFEYRLDPLYKSVENLMNALTKIMLQDVEIEMQNNEVYLEASSIASSLWCCLLDMAQEGHVKTCDYCGRTIVALDERRPRRFCNANCNKNHQRVRKFKKLVDEGMDKAEAAKKAEIGLDKCVSYWSARLEAEGTAQR